MLDNPQPINGSLLAQRSGGWFDGYSSSDRRTGQRFACTKSIEAVERPQVWLNVCSFYQYIHNEVLKMA